LQIPICSSTLSCKYPSAVEHSLANTYPSAVAHSLANTYPSAVAHSLANTYPSAVAHSTEREREMMGVQMKTSSALSFFMYFV
jgi:hypothetical protein